MQNYWNTNGNAEEIRQLTQSVYRLNEETIQNNRLTFDLIHAEVAKIERERRKKRKSVIQEWVAEVNDTYSLICQYDDGTQGATILAMNLVPGTEIYRIQLEGLEKFPRYFGINFRQAGIWIIGEEKKLNGKVLREEMIRKGVIFNGKIAKSKVENALFQFFASKIEKAPLLKIPALAGWNNQKFVTAETFPFEETEGLKNLPVRFKHFDYETSQPFLPAEYFVELKKIKDAKLRVLFMICPILALLNSLINHAGIRTEAYLNFLFLEDVESGKAAKYLQIFNRCQETLFCDNLDDCIKMKDELVTFDCYSDAGDSDYKRKRKKLCCISLAEKITKGELYTPDGCKMTCPVIIFSDSIIRKKRAINIFIDKTFIEGATEWNKETDVIRRTFINFIDFCEKNYSEVERTIQSEKGAKKGDDLRIAYTIFKKFWTSYQIDMEKMADVKMSMIDEALECELAFEDDLIGDFVKIIRKEVVRFSVRMKNREVGDEKEIFYNDEFVWIPTQILHQMFVNCGAEQEKNQFLEKLKREGEMITDDGGLSRKLQVAGKRFETYQFRRELFNSSGVVDIVELGGETQND